GYGPANPELPNREFWNAKAETWNTDLAQAKSMRCGNCAAFIQTPEMIECITGGMEGEENGEENGEEYENNENGEEGESEENEDLEMAVQDAADLGYCELFHFKCAAARTCDAWLVGGPITSMANSRRQREAVAFQRVNFMREED
ncbi:MAG: hypothetical protein ACO3FJ_08160, partial [Ilumatobacteraceae bacterium]